MKNLIKWIKYWMKSPEQRARTDFFECDFILEKLERKIQNLDEESDKIYKEKLKCVDNIDELKIALERTVESIKELKRLHEADGGEIIYNDLIVKDYYRKKAEKYIGDNIFAIKYYDQRYKEIRLAIQKLEPLLKTILQKRDRLYQLLEEYQISKSNKEINQEVRTLQRESKSVYRK